MEVESDRLGTGNLLSKGRILASHPDRDRVSCYEGWP